MKYQLRHFENNFQIVASLGWIFVIIGVVVLFTGPIPAAVLFVLIGALLIWWQLRGKRIIVDTANKTIRSGGKSIQLNNPSMVFVSEVRYSQTVNSHVSSGHVKMYFYKAFIQDGEEKHLISCNRSEKRDKENLKLIATDLNVPFELNY